MTNTVEATHACADPNRSEILRDIGTILATQGKFHNIMMIGVYPCDTPKDDHETHTAFALIHTSNPLHTANPKALRELVQQMRKVASDIEEKHLKRPQEKPTDNTLDVSHLTPAEVLKRVYNAAVSVGLGRRMDRPDHVMTLTEAENLVFREKRDLRFDYLGGRAMKLNLITHPFIDPTGFDLINGAGAMARALGMQPKGKP